MVSSDITERNLQHGVVNGGLSRSLSQTSKVTDHANLIKNLRLFNHNDSADAMESLIAENKNLLAERESNKHRHFIAGWMWAIQWCDSYEGGMEDDQAAELGFIRWQKQVSVSTQQSIDDSDTGLGPEFDKEGAPF